MWSTLAIALLVLLLLARMSVGLLTRVEGARSTFAQLRDWVFGVHDREIGVREYRILALRIRAARERGDTGEARRLRKNLLRQ